MYRIAMEQEVDMPFALDGTGYTAARRDDGTYDVVMVKPHGTPQTIGTFASSAEAQQLIFDLVVPKEPNRPNALI